MPLYDPTPKIIAMSLEELNFILNWIREEQGGSYDNPIAVLIGGWAVDAYNPWYGSVDIDLVTNSETKNTLKTVLKEERGYESYKIPGRINTVSKPTGDGEIKEIIIDYADILALIDPVHGGRELDLNFLGEKLTEFDFLKGCLRNIPENRDAVEKYRQILSLTEVRG